MYDGGRKGLPMYDLRFANLARLRRGDAKLERTEIHQATHGRSYKAAGKRLAAAKSITTLGVLQGKRI